ncbi:MAG: PHP domain-containing protein [Candidatus Heimdallarchaeota archaeon]|nr:PHP domain-containing protein [Candidatus Heimdallarchaeota archaeon]MCK4877125.1 PHP domain-containing protein [Candidatus Heimdallarchaeota archaeon]
MNQSLKTFLKRLLIYNLIIWITIGISIPANVSGPSQYRYFDDDWDDFSYSPEYNETKWNIILDPHSHTFYSDGSLSPRQNLLWHISMGFNAIVLTDHNTFEGIEEIREIARNEYNNTIKVLAGVEWTTARVHLNFIFPPEVESEDFESTVNIKGYISKPTDQEIEAAIAAAHALGGLVSVNHYSYNERLSKNSPTRNQLLDWGVDFFEVVNEDRYYEDNYQFCIDNGLGILASTDMHEPEPVYAWTTLNVSEFSEQAIFDELKEKRTGYIYDSFGAPYDVEHKLNNRYIVLFPLIKIGGMFEDSYTSAVSGLQLGIIFIYIYGIFLLVEGLRYVVPKIKLRMRNRKEESKKST